MMTADYQNKKRETILLISLTKWRRMRDSNPRYPEKGIPDFESSAFGHSANPP